MPTAMSNINSLFHCSRARSRIFFGLLLVLIHCSRSFITIVKTTLTLKRLTRLHNITRCIINTDT